MLKIGGLGLSGLKKDEEEKQGEETKQEQPMNFNKPNIPALKIGGLGLTGLTKDEEEKKVEEVN